MTETRCERCGAYFGCEADTAGDCWCTGVVLDDATRGALAAQFRTCLCPACLAAAARTSATPRVERTG